MSDIWLKLKMLRVYGFSFSEWRKGVWNKEAGARMCCDGYMCGCYGFTNGDWWEHLVARPKIKLGKDQ